MKVIKKLLSVFLAALTLLLVAPFHALDFAFAEDETPSEIFDLIPYNFNTVPSQTESIYNIKPENVSGFTPFDFETGKRMAGTSFKLDSDANSQIINEYVTVSNASIPFDDSKDYALYMWMYFSDYAVHNLKITLEFETTQVVWNMSQQTLLGEVEKYGTSVSSLPHGWNLLRLPFSGANKDDDSYKSQRPMKLTIDYESPTMAQEKYAALRFYHVYIGETNNEGGLFVEKQDYRIASFNGFDEKLKNNLIIGDEITVPTVASVVNYAWEGETDLTNSRQFNNTTNEKTFVWVINLLSPSDNTTKRVYEGNKIKFSEAGNYTLFVQCKDYNDNLIVSYSQYFSVREFTPIFLKNTAQSKKITMKVGTTYKLEFATSQVFSSVGELSYRVVDGDVEIKDLGGGVLEVKAHSTGNFILEVSVDGERVAKPELASYKTEIELEVVKEKKTSNWVFIFIYCVIGAFGVFLIGFVIYSLVKARKFDVK